MEDVREQQPSLLVSRLAESLGTRASVGTAFGEPVERGNVTVIPVASTAWGFGGGGGTGGASAAAPEPTNGKTKRHEGSVAVAAPAYVRSATSSYGTTTPSFARLSRQCFPCLRWSPSVCWAE